MYLNRRVKSDFRYKSFRNADKEREFCYESV